jgi:hypothetical protein
LSCQVALWAHDPHSLMIFDVVKHLWNQKPAWLLE